MFHFNQNPWEQSICCLTIDCWFNEREADWTSIYIPYKCCSLKKFLEHLSCRNICFWRKVSVVKMGIPAVPSPSKSDQSWEMPSGHAPHLNAHLTKKHIKNDQTTEPMTRHFSPKKGPSHKQMYSFRTSRPANCACNSRWAQSPEAKGKTPGKHKYWLHGGSCQLVSG